MMLNVGEKVFVVQRRVFERDSRRHFVGEVERCEATCVRVFGFAFVVDRTNQFVRKPELRTRILSLIEGTYIINVLPSDTQIEKVVYAFQNSRLVLTDQRNLLFDIDEHRAE